MKRTLRIAVAVAIVLSLNACATKVKTFPREVTSKEKRQVNFATGRR
jgi:protein involved in sex pheromone biosynthesis